MRLGSRRLGHPITLSGLNWLGLSKPWHCDSNPPEPFHEPSRGAGPRVGLKSALPNLGACKRAAADAFLGRALLSNSLRGPGSSPPLPFDTESCACDIQPVGQHLITNTEMGGSVGFGLPASGNGQGGVSGTSRTPASQSASSSASWFHRRHPR